MGWTLVVWPIIICLPDFPYMSYLSVWIPVIEEFDKSNNNQLFSRFVPGILHQPDNLYWFTI